MSSHENFAARAHVASEIRAGRLENLDYTIEQAETLYAASFVEVRYPELLERAHDRERSAIAAAIEYGPQLLD